MAIVHAATSIALQRNALASVPYALSLRGLPSISNYARMPVQARNSTIRHKVSIGGWQIGRVGKPRRARLPTAVDRRRSAGIVQKRSGWNDDLSAAARGMRKGRATLAAERRCEAPRLRKVETHHMILPGKPAQGLRQDIGVCGRRAAGGPAASRTMAPHEFDEWQVDLEFDNAAKTPAAHRHAPISVACLAVVFLDAGRTRPQVTDLARRNSDSVFRHFNCFLA